MKKINILCFSLLATIILCKLNSQSTSFIKNNGINKITVYKEKPQKSKTQMIDEITVYDHEGNRIEEIEYNDEGVSTSHIKYEYNSENEKVKEIHLDPNLKVIKTFEYKYQEGLKTEKIAYDGKGKITSRRIYKYEKY